MSLGLLVGIFIWTLGWFIVGFCLGRDRALKIGNQRW